MGVDVTFIDQETTDEEIEKTFRPNTKAVFGETLANPAGAVLDIERFARMVHSYGVPLVVDNMLATPINAVDRKSVV